jgi:PAS domain S-box-containing protein
MSVMVDEICGSELRRKAEELAQAGAARTSEDLQGVSPEAMQKIIFELRVHQIELELQNEELLRAQIELGKSKARFFDLYEMAPVGYCTLSEQGFILEANLTLATLLGVSRKDMVGRPLARFIHREDQDARCLHFSHLADADSPKTTDLRMVRQDGDLGRSRCAAGWPSSRGRCSIGALARLWQRGFSGPFDCQLEWRLGHGSSSGQDPTPEG